MYGYPKDRRSFSAVAFLRRFYKAKNIERHFDAISLHPYGAGVETVRKQIKQARAVVRKAGDRKVGILIGELGWASAGPSKNEEVVGAKGQAKRLRQGLKLLDRKAARLEHHRRLRLRLARLHPGDPLPVVSEGRAGQEQRQVEAGAAGGSIRDPQDDPLRRRRPLGRS